MKLVNGLHQCSCAASRWLLSRDFWRFIGIMHRVSPVRIIRDRSNDLPELAGRTHPAPSSSPGTCCCWWWGCPGAAGVETVEASGMLCLCHLQQLSSRWLFFSSSSSSRDLFEFCRLPVGSSRVSAKTKLLYRHSEHYFAVPFSFFLVVAPHTVESVNGNPLTLSPSLNYCGNIGSFFEQRISHWKGVKHRPRLWLRLYPVFVHCAPPCGKSHISIFILYKSLFSLSAVVYIFTYIM